jgi:hypothetical protein
VVVLVLLLLLLLLLLLFSETSTSWVVLTSSKHTKVQDQLKVALNE